MKLRDLRQQLDKLAATNPALDDLEVTAGQDHIHDVQEITRIYTDRAIPGKKPRPIIVLWGYKNHEIERIETSLNG